MIDTLSTWIADADPPRLPGAELESQGGLAEVLRGYNSCIRQAGQRLAGGPTRLVTGESFVLDRVSCLRCTFLLQLFPGAVEPPALSSV